MFNHVTSQYQCPICLGIRGGNDNNTLIRQSDIVYTDDQVMVFVASYFIESNLGHLIVVPKQHVEHLYDLSDEVGARIISVARHMAIAMKQAYECEGVMLLQNNEPASGQHAFHFHLHLFPRYSTDQFFSHVENKRETSAEERLPYAEKIRGALCGQST